MIFNRESRCMHAGVGCGRLPEVLRSSAARELWQPRRWRRRLPSRYVLWEADEWPPDAWPCPGCFQLSARPEVAGPAARLYRVE